MSVSIYLIETIAAATKPWKYCTNCQSNFIFYFGKFFIISNIFTVTQPIWIKCHDILKLNMEEVFTRLYGFMVYIIFSLLIYCFFSVNFYYPMIYMDSPGYIYSLTDSQKVALKTKNSKILSRERIIFWLLWI